MNFFKFLKDEAFNLFVKIKNGNNDRVEPEVFKSRLKQCVECKLGAGLNKVNGKLSVDGERGLAETGNCKICGCFVKYKTQYVDESCPLGKW